LQVCSPEGRPGFAFLYAGAETAGVAANIAFPVVGGWAGSKLFAKQEDTVYLLKRAAPGVN
jgi:hypothetical protein